MRVLVLALFVFLLLPSFACGVGITAFDLDLEVVFSPNSVVEFDFSGIANKEIDNLRHTVYAEQGPLSQYVTFDRTVFEGYPKGSWIPVHAVLRLPASLPPPEQRLKYCFAEACPNPGQICGFTVACAVVIVHIPYEGKHPVVSLSIANVNERQPVFAVVTVSNPGTEPIQGCGGFVEFFNKKKESVGKADFEMSGNIPTFGSASTSATLDDPSIPPGDYSALATVNCDGIVKEGNATFRVGTLDVKLVNYTKELEIGGIKRFITIIESTWNDPIDVYANIRVFDSLNSSEAKTVTSRLMPWQKLELEAFLDTSNLEAKEYDVAIDVSYQDKISHFKGTVSLIKPAQILQEMVEKEKPGISASTLTIILVIVVIILTAVNVFLAMYRKKKE
jgi:hypothetical protein